MRLTAVLAAALLFASSASAQARPAGIPIDDVEAAKAHFAAGSAYYEQANYADAVKEFNEAYRLSKKTDLLYNIAVSYERLGDYGSAIAALQRYLSERPNASDRVTIETRIENLQRRRDEEEARLKAPAPPDPPEVAPAPAQPEPAPAIAVPPPARKRGWFVPGTVVTGLGGALLLAAVGTGTRALLLHQDLEVACAGGCPPAREADVDTGKALALTTDVLIGVGAAAAVTGAILLIVQGRRPARRAALALSPRVLAVRF